MSASTPPACDVLVKWSQAATRALISVTVPGRGTCAILIDVSQAERLRDGLTAFIGDAAR